MPYQKIFKENNFTETEQEFVKSACDTGYTAQLNQTRIIAELILSKRISESAEKLITSNETLASSNKKYSSRLLFLTWVLVAIGLITVATMFYQIWLSIPSFCSYSTSDPAGYCTKLMPLFGTIKYNASK